MSLQRLRTFIEVYRQKSLSGAARNLNLTQPAVSQHLSSLEASIGRRLFTRDSQGVEPTASADELAADIGDKLDQAEMALASARARSNEIAGALQIVGHADFLAEVVMRCLPPLVDQGVRIRLQAGDSETIQQRLLDGDCDLGISARHFNDKRLICQVVQRERLLAVCAPSTANQILNSQTPYQTLVGQPLLAYSLDLPLIENWLQLNGLNQQPLLPAVIGQDLRALRSLLQSSYGWTLLPEYLCRDALNLGQLVEIPAPKQSSHISYHLVCTPAALRQARISLAHKSLLSSLERNLGKNFPK